jgi:hypothetical protein
MSLLASASWKLNFFLIFFKGLDEVEPNLQSRTMSQYEELNLLMRKLYQYETEILGTGSKATEIDNLKMTINRSLAKIKHDINARNTLRVNREKGKTSQLLKLSAEIKRDIGTVEMLIEDFRQMIENRQLSNKENAIRILENFQSLLTKLQEGENENVLLANNRQPDKFSQFDFSGFISGLQYRGLERGTPRG